MKLLLTNIKELLQVRENFPTKLSGKEMAELPTLKNAWLYINHGIIEDYGIMAKMGPHQGFKTIDCSGKTVLPAWCDSHSHIVYAGNREQEFVDRINGLSYQEIAEKGGGIVNSAKKLQETSEEDLYHQSAARLEEVMKLGTGAIEIKSGYGLTTDAELKMLRVAKKLAEEYPITIKTTFLGAHAIPTEYKGNKDGYLDLLCNEMLPKVAEESLAEYIDIFCEEGYFSVADMDRVLSEGKKYNLIPKVHVNQFNSIGGIASAVKHKALSVDHLEVFTDEDLAALKNSETMPVALPSCSYFLSIPYTPGRKIIDAGLPLALATDYNPGSTPSGNMNFVVATACIKMRLTPEEAINAATINGAYAMGLSETHGSICRGKVANLIITKPIPSYGYLPYAFGSNLIDSVIIGGKEVK
ncbi:imidazolonepropionase [Aequorivita sublithincola DSM 14238]|uniref:Imidazolonepropionase n=1 Tax=Aequorivita sublithincola (strain DSM 14238 / LMG 21431 / ACAM 643 / 9-3) TaxID=746697 RepID=I3YXV7_AEQSU|nr:imidazolonepropionase [Aequorivita sublithincola]AFL81825.1 imidazolonepropionase [Aequorivita sublithincola DSM 14238]